MTTLRYFIPEWDDLVDPHYNFLTDTHSAGRGGWDREVYAHQMYPTPNYDGILVSKVIAEHTKAKAGLINQMGVHRYLRVPETFPIMGDCGAFDYIEQDNPPFTTPEILDYYTRLGFDHGVSIDHLIVPAFKEHAQHRYDLTIQNAEDFLREHRARGLHWEPIGAVQGWDPASYAEAARQYVAMGYRYLALGALVRKQTKDILALLEAVRMVVPAEVKIHLFGIGRLGPTPEFVRLGVSSVDCAGPLRQAWLQAGKGYLTQSGETYAAIRIPQSDKNPRVKRSVVQGRVNADHAHKVEQAALRAIRAYDKGRESLETTMAALAELDHFIDPNRPDHTPHNRRTLEAMPWKSCPCDICREVGVEVIIFRGNNRNRRRGFHNTWVWYRLLQRVLRGEATMPVMAEEGTEE